MSHNELTPEDLAIVPEKYRNTILPPLRLSWLPYPANPTVSPPKDFLFTNSPCSKLADELKAKNWNDVHMKNELMDCAQKHEQFFVARLRELSDVTLKTVGYKKE
eukprot:CAMPEP_0117435298 /NCGR_PEP_ID=MMETSP0759-20121206/407_1 /TAXON_ID=63605 /ORGANISM="Percolomonas cosmopolitus, Strain WS" /LENGTH=104 /DNA_ID=CAMNT_0005226837 /DNA_START=97 /DNA_END=411 /DNA_ORIENTATION=-